MENNLNEIPISLKEFFLEKYKINEKGRYSRLILHTEEKKMNKNKAKKKISIKKGIHNIKIINKYKKNNIKIKKISKINNKNNSNSLINSKSFSKRRKNKLIEEFTDNNYNVYPKRRKHHSKDSHSYSNSKIKNNEYSVYKAKKDKLMKLFSEQYPFMPSIRENKKFKIKSTFDERQKKFIEDKKKKFKEKEQEELKEIEEMKKYYNKSKTNIQKLVKKLYDDEAEKIKERLKTEKEKSKKKKIIDWDKRNKLNREKYPEEYKINIKSKDRQKHPNLKLENYSSVSKEKETKNNSNKRTNTSKNKKKKKENIPNKNDINKNQKLLLEKIKDEHVIGFKNNVPANSNKLNNEIKNNPEINEEKKEDKKIIENNIINTLKDNENTNATNSLNVSKNFSNKNKLSIKTNRDAIFKDNNFFKVSKNYFQLTDKEKYFPSNKKLLKNTHSFNFHKKRLNIYNNIFVNSDNSIKMDDRYETIDRESNIKNIDKNNMMNSGLILHKNKEINILKNNKDIKINDKKIKKNFKDNFRNKNNDFLHDYKLNTKLTNKFNNNKNYSNYFTNNISTNGIGYFMSINKPCPKKIKKNSGSLLNLKKNKIKTKYKQDYDFENLINFNNNDKNEVISYLSKNKKSNNFNIEKLE